MTTTSELERYCRRPSHLGFDATAFKAALQHDWDAGTPVEITGFDPDGKNGAIFTEDGYAGGVGVFDVQTKRHFVGYRWIAKNNGPTWRSVFGKATDGRIVHVGKLRRYTAWAKAHGYT